MPLSDVFPLFELFADNHTCPVDHFKCSSNRCIPKRWLCDGTNDCGNNEDEANTTCSGMYSTTLLSLALFAH